MIGTNRRILATSLALTLLAIAWGSRSRAEDDGQWQPSPDGFCWAGQVCADWFMAGRSSGFSCCIPPDKLWTADFDACNGEMPIYGDYDPEPPDARPDT